MTSELTRPATAPTLDDVARRAGVSIATASRVLNGSTRKVAESYRERVTAAATELGYTANLSAQATARGTADIVALIVADLSDPYFALLAAGVARGADEAGLIVTVASTGGSDRSEAELVRALRGQRPRGLILAASRSGVSSPEFRRELDAMQATGTRIVALGSGTEGIRSVGVDNRSGAHELAAELANLGYRRAIVLAAADGVRTSDDRLAGYRDGFAAHGGRIERVYRDGFGRDSGERLMAQALAEGVESGTLVLCVSDAVAIGASRALRSAGREVGADVALAGFDDIPTARDMTPELTTVHVPLRDVGYDALHALLDETGSAAPQRPLEVVIRASTPGR